MSFLQTFMHHAFAKRLCFFLPVNPRHSRIAKHAASFILFSKVVVSRIVNGSSWDFVIKYAYESAWPFAFRSCQCINTSCEISSTKQGSSDNKSFPQLRSSSLLENVITFEQNLCFSVIYCCLHSAITSARNYNSLYLHTPLTNNICFSNLKTLKTIG